MEPATIVERTLQNIFERSQVIPSLATLASLCADDRAHSLEVLRKGFNRWFVQSFVGNDFEINELEMSLRVLNAAVKHDDFIKRGFYFLENSDRRDDENYIIQDIQLEDKISVDSIIYFIDFPKYGKSITDIAILLLFRLLAGFPVTSKPVEGIEVSADVLFLRENHVNFVIKQLVSVWHTAPAGSYCPVDTRCLAVDILAAFLSDAVGYGCNFDNDGGMIARVIAADIRYESPENRKTRLLSQRILSLRSKKHSERAVAAGVIAELVLCLDDDEPVVRQHAAACFSRLVSSLDDDESLKHTLKSNYFLNCVTMDPGSNAYDAKIAFSSELLVSCRIRALITSNLFLTTRNELGCWALELAGGSLELLLLISTGHPRNQEIATDVISVAASTEQGAAHLGRVVESEALQTLLKSPQITPKTRAAAAAALAKLTVRARALTDASSDITTMFNVASDLIKAVANLAPASSTDQHSSETRSTIPSTSFSSRSSAGGRGHADPRMALTPPSVSFSSYDNTASTSSSPSTSSASSEWAVGAGAGVSAAMGQALEQALEILV